uniref:Thymidylate synthase n=1 Tax=Tetranychus urticae TaxID=32264 RepID=T1JUG7_TETUR
MKVGSKQTRMIVPVEDVFKERCLKSFRQILKKGTTKIDRTGVRTIQVFGIQNRYKLTFKTEI